MDQVEIERRHRSPVQDGTHPSDNDELYVMIGERLEDGEIIRR
jgi:hypothetical protein